MRAASIRNPLVAALLLAMSAGAQAQINSVANNLNVSWFDPENLFVQVNFEPGTGNFQQLDGAVTPTTSPINVQVNYNGLVNRQTLNLYAYFADPARALSNGNGGAVPAGDIEAIIQGGGASRFTQPSPFSASSVLLASSAAVATNGNGSMPASFSLAIKGTNYGTGFFVGTLILQAQAI
ncbi:MAG TPA: hypothetical protein VN716_17455 [Vicinamibacterales bacterium]|nr:hypothetical protein [Vicinamibacterales bacterium]